MIQKAVPKRPNAAPSLAFGPPPATRHPKSAVYDGVAVIHHGPDFLSTSSSNQQNKGQFMGAIDED